jgi:hypothetical protein
MSGANPNWPPPAKAGAAAGGLAAGGPAADASMEDILASIRRILNDEETQPVAQGGQTMANPDPVLQLDPSMMVPAPETEPPAMSPPSPAAIVAPEAAAAAAQSIGSLVRTLTAERAMQVHSGGPTIEDIVRAEIRPILKHWLDTNLPPMVERLVRAEIERVVGRAVP